MAKQRSFLFDVKLWATVRVLAIDEKQARKRLAEFYGQHGDLPGYSTEYVEASAGTPEDLSADELVEIDDEAC